MTWWIVFFIIMFAGFWWDTARQNLKIKDLIEAYSRQRKIGGARELNDLFAQIERWTDAQ